MKIKKKTFFLAGFMALAFCLCLAEAVRAETINTTSNAGNIDFNWNQLFLDGGRFSVGIGNDQPDLGYMLDIKRSDSTDVYMKVQGNNSNAGIVIKQGDGYEGSLQFKESTGTVGQLTYDTGNRIRLLNGSAGITISSIGNTGINEPSPESTLHVPDGYYAQFENNGTADPPAGDCDSDDEIGRLYIRTDTQELWICGGATNGWDYITLTD